MYRATLSWSQPQNQPFTDLVRGSIFCPIEKQGQFIVIGGLRRNHIIQEPKEWPGQIHELHRLQQTTIRGEEAALSKTTSPAKKQIFNLQQNRNPNKKDKKKKKINIQLPQKYFCQTP
jgi:hypothetical protein